MIRALRWIEAACFVALIALALLLNARVASLHTQLAHKDTEIAQLKTAAADTARAHEEAARQESERLRALEHKATAEVERIARDQDRKLSAADVRAVRAERVTRGLRDEIARLNRRPAPTDPGAAAFAHEATVARELFGACAEEYRGLAKEADGLRVQVDGLIDHEVNVVGIGP